MAVSFGIRDALIAARTAADTYGAAVDIPYIQMMSASLRVATAEGTGDDRIVITASRAIAGNLQVRVQGAPFTIFPILLGVTPDVTGVTPNKVTQIAIPGGQRMPAFGIVGQGLAEEGLGDVLLFAPNVKVTSDITLISMEYGNLSTFEFSATALADDDYGILSLVERETTSALAAATFPPTGIGS